jgi:hypothetical protein
MGRLGKGGLIPWLGAHARHGLLRMRVVCMLIASGRRLYRSREVDVATFVVCGSGQVAQAPYSIPKVCAGALPRRACTRGWLLRRRAIRISAACWEIKPGVG